MILPQSLYAPFPLSSLATSSAFSFSAGWLLFIHPLSRLSVPLCLYFSFSQLLSCYLHVPLSVFCCVFPSSVLVPVLSPAIACFRATLIAPQLLVVAARSRLPCVFMPQLKKVKIKNFLAKISKTNQKQGPQHTSNSITTRITLHASPTTSNSKSTS